MEFMVSIIDLYDEITNIYPFLDNDIDIGRYLTIIGEYSWEVIPKRDGWIVHGEGFDSYLVEYSNIKQEAEKIVKFICDHDNYFIQQPLVQD